MKKLDKYLLKLAKEIGVNVVVRSAKYPDKPIFRLEVSSDLLTQYNRQCDVYRFCKKHGIKILND